jgi:hypothetical protein
VPPPANQQSTLYSHYPLEPSMNLGNGIFIGVGFVLLFFGSLIAFSQNGIFNQQVSYFTAEGIQVNTYAFFEGLVRWISIGVLMAVLGAYSLVLGAVNQFSVTIRTAMNLKDTRVRLGNGFIIGGLVFSALSVNNVVVQFYRYTFNGMNADVTVYIYIALVGLVLIVVVALVFRSDYLLNQRRIELNSKLSYSCLQ